MSSIKEDNSAVEVWFNIEKDPDGYPKSRDSEGLVCKLLDPGRSLCNVASVPFYVRNVAYGDTISTKDNPAGYLEFRDVVKHGGFSVYRILLHDSARKEDVIRKLLEFDVLLEHDGDLIAIAVPPSANSDALVDYILAGKEKGFWGAQDGYIFEEPGESSG